jgi:hypothetical protein
MVSAIFCLATHWRVLPFTDSYDQNRPLGRIKGELRASDLLIGDGAQIEGSVIAQDVTVCGRVKGTAN